MKMEKSFYHNSNNCITSLQTTGLDIVLGLNHFQQQEELFYCDNFACFKCVINDLTSIVIVKTSMYPSDYNNITNKDKDNYIDFVLNVLLKDENCDNYDIYYLGVGLRQTGVDIKEAGKFIVGRRYTGTSDSLWLIRKSLLHNYGFVKNKALLIQNLDYFKSLSAIEGELDSYYCLDKKQSIYRISVKKDSINYLYDVYLDIQNKVDIKTNSTLHGFEIKNELQK